jgi:hypothetical protein
VWKGAGVEVIALTTGPDVKGERQRKERGRGPRSAFDGIFRSSSASSWPDGRKS